METVTQVAIPLLERSKEELVQIIERHKDNLAWYVAERNRLLEELRGFQAGCSFSIQHERLKSAAGKVWDASPNPCADSMHFYHRVCLQLLGKVNDYQFNLAVCAAERKRAEEVEEYRKLMREDDAAKPETSERAQEEREK